MNVPTYDHFELQPALAANFCFDLRPELRGTTRKTQGKRWGIQIANHWWRRGCFFVTLLPQRLESMRSEEASDCLVQYCAVLYCCWVFWHFCFVKTERNPLPILISSRSPTCTVVPRLTNVPTYDHFELRPALAAKCCFDLQLELRVAIKRGRGKKGNFEG